MTNGPVVIDTSVFISALITPGKYATEAIEHVIDEQGRLYFSQATYQELHEKLNASPKLSKLIPADERQLALQSFALLARWVPISGAAMGCRDREDDMFLETARNCGASCILSLDTDLLTMSPWQGIKILKPADFLRR